MTAQLLAGAQAVGRAGAHPRRHLVVEAGHPHLEELVEQVGEDGQELDPLEQGHLGVVGEVEQAGPEVQPRQLPVGEPLVAEGGDVRRRRSAARPRPPAVGASGAAAPPGRTGRRARCRSWKSARGSGSPSTVRRVSPERTTPRYAHGVAQTAVRRPPATWARTHRLPPWPRGTKPRRRTELGLLFFAAVITVAFYVIAELGAKNKIPPHLGPILGRHPGDLPRGPRGQPLAGPERQRRGPAPRRPLNGIGYVIIVRWTPPTAKAQATWAVLGIGLYVLTLLVIQHSRDLDRYRYLLLLGAGVLLVAPLIPHVGATILAAPGSSSTSGRSSSSRSRWPRSCSCIFFASYFAEKKELLSIPTARVGDRLVLDPRPLFPILVAWGVAIVVIGVEDDIGFAMLIFTLFIAMLWVTTGRSAYLLFGVVLFAVGAVAVSHIVPQVDTAHHHMAAPQAHIPAGPGRVRPGPRGHRGVGPRARPRRRQHLRHQQRHDLRRHRRRDGLHRGRRRRAGLPALGRGGPAHRPDRPLGLLQAGGHRPHHDRRLPGLLHHGRGAAAAAPHRHHPPLRRLRGAPRWWPTTS